MKNIINMIRQNRIMKNRDRIIKNLLFSICGCVMLMSGTCDDPVDVPVDTNKQHQNANIYTFWNWQGNEYYNIDQRINVHQSAPSTYWALRFDFANTDKGGYMGLQTDKSGNNSLAIFSIWEANGYEMGSTGSYCIDFSGEGKGKSCRIPYNFNNNHVYRLRVWRLKSDNMGQWWGAWIMDVNTNKEIHLGNIRSPHGKVLTNTTNNFVEYFGGALPCDGVPKSIATFYPPTANNNDPTNSYQYSSSYKNYSRAACVRGIVNLQNEAAKVTHGGQ